ncbi:MAG: ABC transporter substrate-binding protein [Chloroflexi bacterium]|nr:ABC transporter substrate-binding protein [Chloroflexota bacterium]
MSGKMNRRDFLRLTAATAGALATGYTGYAATSPQQALASMARRQNLASHVTIGNTSIQPNLSPFYFTYFQSRQIYDTLIEVTADGQLIPGLATEWNRVDPQTLEITLRDDVFFSNGDRFTARSVAYSLEFLMTVGVENVAQYAIPLTDLVLFPPQFSLFNNESIEIIDDTRMLVRTTRPDPILERRLSRFFILSEQYMSDTDGDLVTQAAGTGYFKVAEFVPGERIDFETWEGNWRGEYPIQTATYVRVGDLRSALESGDIDIAQNLPPDVARSMADSGDWNVSSKPSYATEIVSMIPSTHEALQDERVRRALNLAIDNEAYNEVILSGFGTPTTGQLLQPGMDGYNPDLEGFGYDPEEAIRLLREAGHANLELSMLAANTIRTQAEVIASFLESVGVRINLETPDSGTVISEVRGGTEKNLILWNAFYTTLQDWSQAMVGLVNQAPESQRHIDSDEFYALNAQISMATDKETRNELIRQAAQLMHDEASLIFLSWVETFYVHSKDIESVPFNLDNSPQIYAIEKQT